LTVDLRQACETILSRLDVRAEAEALGVAFAAASPSPSGWLPCRAVGRVDRNPSAALNVGSDGLRGLYRDLGDAGGRAIGFFDLAVRIGRFPDRESAVRHYAEKIGVGIPPEGSGVPHAVPSLEDRVAWIPAGPSDPADRDAWCRRQSGILPAALRAFGARKCRWPRNPASGSPCWCLAGRREDSNAAVALLLSVVARNPSRKNARGFFLSSCGEVLGSRKKLQEKDLQHEASCGLLECSREDVRSSLAGGKP
jgi:hypothetical protein